MYMKSKLGEVKTREEWEKEISLFWDWVITQNRYINNINSKTHKREFKKPLDYFERYAKILGLTTVSYEGVF